jgi:diketogulonate reductase-like aldo/keto reductase
MYIIRIIFSPSTGTTENAPEEKAMTAQKSFSCTNGVEIPGVGYGTFMLTPGEESVRGVMTALEVGYRHIDTAAIYNNERDVGKALRASGVPRAKVFITTKVWNTERGYDKALRAFDTSMKELGLDYLDLYLVHWPATKRATPDWKALNRATWRALETLYNEKRIRAIGVSNFLAHHLEPLLGVAEVKPMVNQIEYHPGLLREETLRLCHEHGIVVEAWGPLGRGKALDHPAILDIARRHAKTPAQVLCRWCLQNGTLPLPKSAHPERIQENFALFNFELSAGDMESINALPSFCDAGLEPDEIDF